MSDRAKTYALLLTTFLALAIIACVGLITFIVATNTNQILTYWDCLNQCETKSCLKFGIVDKKFYYHS